jgi:hypothetical protein
VKSEEASQVKNSGRGFLQRERVVLRLESTLKDVKKSPGGRKEVRADAEELGRALWTVWSRVVSEAESSLACHCQNCHS